MATTKAKIEAQILALEKKRTAILDKIDGLNRQSDMLDRQEQSIFHEIEHLEYRLDEIESSRCSTCGGQK